ncbi:hypothetical protein BOX15_Mlig001548g2 [Macrostomum lignano]|uniref:Uncharacterized protein n=1 Tax=Macrostomum lignano TaxID=282301 RepID=A0A267GEY1_9PLAT|nr:hypothetical protein BOX15_Mlig001548g2 [Macrostomum lignano]
MTTEGTSAVSSMDEQQQQQQKLPENRQQEKQQRKEELLCCCRLMCVTPREDPLEFSSCLSIVLLVLGIVLISFGYLVPRQYTQDDRLTARENERNAIYYYKLGRHMDVCILVGISVLSLGSIMLSAVLSYTLYQHEKLKASKASGELAK